MRLIKRYSNRKLYDTTEKRYLTLQHLSHLVSQGDQVRVVDNESGDDITSVILSKAISDKEAESGGFLSSELLSSLLQGGPQQILDLLKRSWDQRKQLLSDLEAVYERNMKALVDRGQISHREALRLRDGLVEGLRERWSALETGVERRLSAALDAMPIATRRDMDRLEARIEELAGRLSSVARPAAAKARTEAAAGASGQKPRRKPARKAATPGPGRTAKAAPRKKAPARSVRGRRSAR